jgi:hypothetical protein
MLHPGSTNTHPFASSHEAYRDAAVFTAAAVLGLDTRCALLDPNGEFLTAVQGLKTRPPGSNSTERVGLYRSERDLQTPSPAPRSHRVVDAVDVSRCCTRAAQTPIRFASSHEAYRDAAVFTAAAMHGLDTRCALLDPNGECLTAAQGLKTAHPAATRPNGSVYTAPNGTFRRQALPPFASSSPRSGRIEMLHPGSTNTHPVRIESRSVSRCRGVHRSRGAWSRYALRATRPERGVLNRCTRSQNPPARQQLYRTGRFIPLRMGPSDAKPCPPVRVE